MKKEHFFDKVVAPYVSHRDTKVPKEELDKIKRKLGEKK